MLSPEYPLPEYAQTALGSEAFLELGGKESDS